MKKVFKNPIFMFILGAVVFGSIGVFASQIAASNITYNNTTVDLALNDLYSRVGTSFGIDDNYFVAAYGSQSSSRTVTRTLSTGKYILSLTDGRGTKYSISSANESSDAISLSCDKTCTINKIDEHMVRSSQSGYYDIYHAIYVVDILSDDTVITQVSTSSSDDGANAQAMTMQIIKLS